MKNAIFIVGGPGSGKDVLLRYVSEKYSIPEYTIEQLNSKLHKNQVCENFLVKGNAYELDKIVYIKRLVEDNYYNASMIFVDVENDVSLSRMSSRNINEETRFNKFTSSKFNLDIFYELFENFLVFENNSEFEVGRLSDVEPFIDETFNPIGYMVEKKLNNIKSYVYSKFMSDKDKERTKPKSWFSNTPIRPDGYSDYDIRTSGSSNVVHYSEDIGSPEENASLTGMSFQNKEDNPTLDKVIVEPANKKNKLNPKFNSPTKRANESEIWNSAKNIILERDSIKRFRTTKNRRRK